tara:strand:+ start:585 stop:785 length:201 start_codon:yes stop_codon:yes gene_type:complete
MPTITTIKEYTRGSKTFPIGTEIKVSWDKAKELADAGICEPLKAKKTKKKSKKIKEDGYDSSTTNN